MSVANDLERQMLDLINAERTSRGLQPVQLELRLNDAAEDHSAWMLNTDTFSHTGAGGSSPTERMIDAGFQLSGSWRTAENIAWQSIRGALGLADDVVNLHDALMNSTGHRQNILNPDVTVIGIGIETGEYMSRGVNYDAIMVTQNFARTSAAVQIDSAGSTDTSGGGGSDTPSSPIIVGRSKAGDGGDDWFILEAGKSGKLNGRGGNDQLEGADGNDSLLGRSGNDTLIGNDGHDKLRGGTGNDNLDGGNGNDNLKGQSGDDTLSGGDGEDQVLGGRGNDILAGNDGDDVVKGDIGDDRLDGGNGNDVLNGGKGSDILTGGDGDDNFVFSKGIDVVTDFSSGDQVSLKSSKAIRNYTDLMDNHISQSGGDVVIDDGRGNSLILEDTLLTDLDRGDFIF